MLIFIIPTSYPNEDNVVANSFVQEQVKALILQGYDVVVLNVQKQPSKKLFYRIDRHIYKDKDNISDVVRKKQKTIIEKRLSLINQFIFDKSVKKLYCFAIKEYGTPDLIYAHFYKAGYSAIKATKKNSSSVPVVVMEHSGDLMDKIRTVDKFFLKYVIEKSKAYICTTDNLKESVLKITHSKKEIKVIPNVIDSIFEYSALKRTNDMFCFFSLARLEFDKRLDLLIQAFCETFSPEENVELKIGGIGSELQHLKHEIEDYNRSHQIKLLGQLNRTQVAEEMKNCNCFVLPSRHETFGLVWREALCVGRPVITTNHGGFSGRDWEDSFGEMIPVDDLKSLSEALLSIKNNYSKYDLRYISDKNSEKYSLNSVGKQLSDLFKDSIDR